MDIRTYLERRGHRFRHESNRFVTRCPFHEETKPSFTIYPGGRAWCYSCSWSGDLADLVHALEFPQYSDPTPSQWREIFQVAGMDRQGERVISHQQTRDPSEDEIECMTIAYQHYREVLAETFQGQGYLRRRGITNVSGLPLGCSNGSLRYFRRLTDRMKERFGGGWRDLARRVGILWDGGERAYNRIFIAEVREGRVLYFVLRAFSGQSVKYLNPPGAIRRRILGIESLERDVPCCFITEGPFDMLPVIARGGSAVAMLGSYAAELPLLAFHLQVKGMVPVVATDWDGDAKHGGEMGARKLTEYLETAGLHPVRLPQVPGCTDLGNWAQKYPEQDWRDLWTYCLEYATLGEQHGEETNGASLR
jgi:hypothetical protein